MGQCLDTVCSSRQQQRAEQACIQSSKFLNCPSGCKRANQRLFYSFKTDTGAEKAKRSRKKTVDLVPLSIEPELPLSPLSCRLAGSISDWVQDQKQELFPSTAKTDQSFDLSLTSIIFLVSALPLISQHSLTVTDAYWIYPYLTLSPSSPLLFLSLLSLGLANREKITNMFPGYVFFFIPQHRGGGRLRFICSILLKSLLSASCNEMGFVIILHAFVFWEIDF